jgi:hypothetical protein
MCAGAVRYRASRKVYHPQAHTTGGRRADLDSRYFRSAAEANIARLFNHLMIPWEYEPREFKFPIDHGARSYLPDFRIDLRPWADSKRSTQGWPSAFLKLAPKQYWVEVKGWMNPSSQTKLSRFFQYHPEEAQALILLADDPMRSAARWKKGLVKKLRKSNIPIIDLRVLLQLGSLLGIEHWEV